ncbi:polysaccharide biosynthesis tyrosine autokinase [Geothrix oryzisoli]|uniref:polysaccharide biosynthesis tyrosine autokinase n=1 Tax=Geothrix oryzisoli TaxID=2922721 RepID=UPI001FACE3D7|nr:polysaccharide biosynthesis tyrosine autokinase [Geothrix oryzisoli]
MSTNPGPKPSHRRNVRTAHEAEEIHFWEWLDDLWEGRYLILAGMFLFLVVGGCLRWRSVPVYQAEGLLQISAKKPLPSDPAFAKMERFFSDPGTALAEVEILKSDLVLGRAVRSLGLDLVAEPVDLTHFGRGHNQGGTRAPELKLEVLQVPERLMSKAFRITVLSDGTFQWLSPAGKPLGTGKPGETVSAVLDGDPLALKVQALATKPGREFLVYRKPLAVCIRDLRQGLEVAERGKETDVIGLVYKDTSPDRCEDVLNAIMAQYVQYRLEKKAGDANQTRALLEQKIGPLKAQLDESEQRLNQFRSRFGAVDLSREAESLLTQGTNLGTQISNLEQKKQEALRTYQENSDVVRTLNQQIDQLKAESARVSGRMRALPGTQQEVVRLSRAVQVNTELYTALLNNIQQLQISSAGEVGSVGVVDPATTTGEPIGPKAPVMLAFYAALGALVGIGATVIRQLLHRGIKDHRLIESKLGLPVLVTIPHSRDQEKHSTAVDLGLEGSHLLAAHQPDDLAIESLRSLRTSLLFSLKDAKSRTIMLTGSRPSVGKSFLSANLAIMLAQMEARVLLVDADLRKGILHRYFGPKGRLTGLSDVLSGRCDWSSAASPTEFPGLDLVSTGVLPADASQLLLSPRFGAFVAEVSAAYDYVIFDAPPLLPVTDGTIIGAFVGTVILVAKFGEDSIDDLRACQQRAEGHGIRIDGCIFNDILPTGLGYGYQGYRYAYHYKYK